MPKQFLPSVEIRKKFESQDICHLCFGKTSPKAHLLAFCAKISLSPIDSRYLVDSSPISPDSPLLLAICGTGATAPNASTSTSSDLTCESVRMVSTYGDEVCSICNSDDI